MTFTFFVGFRWKKNNKWMCSLPGCDLRSELLFGEQWTFNFLSLGTELWAAEESSTLAHGVGTCLCSLSLFMHPTCTRVQFGYFYVTRCSLSLSLYNLFIKVQIALRGWNGAEQIIYYVKSCSVLNGFSPAF